MKKFIAFTLAETLIVMGIIGVVAALTLPNLNSSTGDKEKVVKLKKIYSDLNDAYGRAQAVYGPVEDWFINDNNTTAQTTRFGERITEFIKLSKNCKMTKGCYTQGSGAATGYEFILADGASVSAGYFYGPSFNIDIDGVNKGKNLGGIDRFRFVGNSIDKNIIEPEGEITPQGLPSSCSKDGDNTQCTYWVVNYDNMDYLKIDSNAKCPNGSTLNALASPPVISCK